MLIFVWTLFQTIKKKLQNLSSTIRQQTIIRHIEQIVAKSLRLQLWLAAADFPH